MVSLVKDMAEVIHDDMCATAMSCMCGKDEWLDAARVRTTTALTAAYAVDLAPLVESGDRFLEWAESCEQMYENLHDDTGWRQLVDGFRTALARVQGEVKP